MFLVHFSVPLVFLLLANHVSGGLLDWLHGGKQTTVISSTAEVTNNPKHFLEVTTASSYNGEKDCIDTSPNCSSYMNTLCKDKEYTHLMAKICPLTCHACCVDKTDRCQEWKEKGFCNREFYQVMAKKTCPSTCGHCNPSFSP